MNFFREANGENDDVILNDDPNSREWLAEAGEAYMEGWKQAVSDFWDMVKDKL